LLLSTQNDDDVAVARHHRLSRGDDECGVKLSWTNGNWTNGLIMGRAYVLEWTSDGIAATTARDDSMLQKYANQRFRSVRLFSLTH
jgi:hypothetical protein